MNYALVFFYLTLSDSPVFVDLGAHVGDYSEFFWRVYSPRLSKIISVEPHPENIEKIRQKIKKFDASGKWLVEECAVDTEEGEADFKYYRTPAGDPNGALAGMDELINHANKHYAGILNISETETIKVKKKTMHSICPNPAIIKIDIEGNEWAVLPELMKMPSVYALIIEFTRVGEYKLEECLAMLHDNGFTRLMGHTECDKMGRWFCVMEDVPPSLRWEDLPGEPPMNRVMHILAQRTI